MDKDGLTWLLDLAEKAGKYIHTPILTVILLLVGNQVAEAWRDLRAVLKHHARKAKLEEQTEMEELKHELAITKQALEEAEFRAQIAKNDK